MFCEALKRFLQIALECFQYNLCSRPSVFHRLELLTVSPAEVMCRLFPQRPRNPVGVGYSLKTQTGVGAEAPWGFLQIAPTVSAEAKT